MLQRSLVCAALVALHHVPPRVHLTHVHLSRTHTIVTYSIIVANIIIIIVVFNIITIISAVVSIIIYIIMLIVFSLLALSNKTVGHSLTGERKKYSPTLEFIFTAIQLQNFSQLSEPRDQYGYKKCGTHARVESPTFARVNS